MYLSKHHILLTTEFLCVHPNAPLTCIYPPKESSTIISPILYALEKLVPAISPTTPPIRMSLWYPVVFILIVPLL